MNRRHLINERLMKGYTLKGYKSVSNRGRVRLMKGRMGRGNCFHCVTFFK